MAILKAYTIGFTKRRAAEFFDVLRSARIKRLIDIRLNNSSQLAGFTKHEDLPFFLRELCGAEYSHNLLLAPTKSLLDAYRKKRIRWGEYERQFLQLMADRRIETLITPELFDMPTVLLCSETTAENFHRRLVLEYLACQYGDLEIVHL